MAALSLVRDDVNLDSLAEQANDFHARSEEAGRARIEYALAAGAALIEAKRLVPHGQWLPWLAENFDGSEATAKRYMTLARNRSRVSDLVDDNPDLSIREAVKHLTKPKDKPTTGTCAECGDTFPLKELTDSEDGKLCDNCLEEGPQYPVQPVDEQHFARVNAADRQIHELLNEFIRSRHALNPDQQELAVSMLQSIRAATIHIEDIFHGRND